ncbi:tyrosine-protein phosphatase, partial [Rhodoferax sp.]|uniref:tyrosine-protein phosphatase n=1 Tax=Rhodoferax sp. TaxID=50421 RepID=UPI002611716F
MCSLEQYHHEATPRLHGAGNFRSLRGMPAANGARIGSHALLRSDHLVNLTECDWNTLGELGLQTICDLRGPEERIRAPTSVPSHLNVRTVNFDIQNDVRNNPKLVRSLADSPTPNGAHELMLRIYRNFPAAFAPWLSDWF